MSSTSLNFDHIILIRIVVILFKQHLQISMTQMLTEIILGRVRKAICSHVGNINFADPANIRQVHSILMNEVRNETM